MNFSACNDTMFPSKPEQNLILAPMADVTNRAYRMLCKRHGACYTVTEMVNADAIVHGSSMDRARRAGEEGPYGIQVFGSSPVTLGEAAAILEASCTPASIDINLGCPSPVVRRVGAGSSLLSSPGKIASVIESVCDAVEIPVTAKMRIVEDMGQTLEIAETIEAAGAAALVVHARTVDMGYSGVAKHEYTRRICERVSIPVIASGDVRDGPSATEVLEFTGCAGLMIGRAALGDPGVFGRIRDYLETGEVEQPPDCEEKFSSLAEYFGLLRRYDLCSRVNLRAHAGWFTKGLRNAGKMRRAIAEIREPASIPDYLVTHFPDA
jgi:nifR3 family TIM-barrel protein